MALWCLMLMLGAAAQTKALNILLIPLNMNSHVAMFGRMAATLHDAGHQSVLLLPSHVPPPLEDHLTVTRYRGSGKLPVYDRDDISEYLVRIKLSKTRRERAELQDEMLRIVVEAFNHECYNFFTDGDLLKDLRLWRFDLAVVDTSGWPCIMNFPSMLDLPHIAFSLPYQPWSHRHPELPSFTPSTSTRGYDLHMTFTQRFWNTLSFFADRWRFDVANPVDLGVFKPGANHVTMEALMAQSKLWFLLEDISLSVPAPRMPSAIPIGDLMARPSNDLPEEVKKFLDDSPDGALLISFGSVLDFLPVEILAIFCEAFEGLPQRVIWKTKRVPPCYAGGEEENQGRRHRDVLVVPWLPQNDALGHANLHLLLTHGGWNSLVEAVYHAKPTLIFPITADQPRNARLAADRGLGTAMDLATVTAEDIVRETRNLLANNTTRKCLRHSAALLRNKPLAAGARVAFWVEHVVQYGDKHLRNSAAFELSFWEFYMLDVLGALFLLAMASTVAMSVIIKRLLVIIGRCFSQSTAVKNKRE